MGDKEYNNLDEIFANKEKEEKELEEKLQETAEKIATSIKPEEVVKEKPKSSVGFTIDSSGLSRNHVKRMMKTLPKKRKTKKKALTKKKKKSKIKAKKKSRRKNR